MTMNPDEQFDLDMLQAIRMVARDAKGRPDKQDPDVVLARARETIHFQKRRIREVESLHDRRLDEQRRAEREVEELKKQLIDARRLLDGHLHAYSRLRATVESRIRLEKQLQNGLRACTDGSHPDDAVVSKASVVQALTTLPA